MVTKSFNRNCVLGYVNGRIRLTFNKDTRN